MSTSVFHRTRILMVQISSNRFSFYFVNYLHNEWIRDIAPGCCLSQPKFFFFSAWVLSRDFYTDKVGSLEFIGEKNLYLVMEYSPGGNLREQIWEEGRLYEEKVQKIFGQLLSAVKCCPWPWHLPLRPEAPEHPARLDAEGDVKLGDSGLGTSCGAGTVLQVCCRTEIYNAPVLRKGDDGRKAVI